MKETKKIIPLTKEQNDARLLFIGKCVDENVLLPTLLKFGVTEAKTVQDLSSANVQTLQNVGKQIKKQLADFDPEFSSDNSTLKISGIDAEKWVEFIKFTIRKKQHESLVRESAGKIAKIQEELETMKSPSERKEELQKRLADLQSEISQ